MPSARNLHFEILNPQFSILDPSCTYHSINTPPAPGCAPGSDEPLFQASSCFTASVFEKNKSLAQFLLCSTKLRFNRLFYPKAEPIGSQS